VGAEALLGEADLDGLRASFELNRRGHRLVNVSAGGDRMVSHNKTNPISTGGHLATA
jgi:hypothetical protein